MAGRSSLKSRRRKRKFTNLLSGLSEVRAGGLRQWIGDHSAVVTVVAVVVFVLALLTIFIQTSDQSGPVSTVEEVYFYDLNSGNLFQAARDEIPPIESPSGPHEGKPAGVRAYLFTCGDCTTKQWTIGYLETFTHESRQALLEERRMQASNPNSRKPVLRPDTASAAVAKGWMIRTVDGVDWSPVRHPQAGQIMADAIRCERAVARPCYPR